MKTITPYLVKFAVAATLLTLVFRLILSFGIESQSQKIITIASIVYGILMFVAGLYFGKKDAEYLPINDIGFRSHLVTFIIHNGLSILWIASSWSAPTETLLVPMEVAKYWGIALVIHFIFYIRAKRNSINNLHKEEIFD